MRFLLSQNQTPSVSFAEPSDFSGLAAERVAPLYESPSLLRLATIMKPILSAIDGLILALSAKLSTPVFCATSGSATDRSTIQMAGQSRLLWTRKGIFLSVDIVGLWKSFHEMNTKNHGILLTW
jgi:hypothetical protein